MRLRVDSIARLTCCVFRPQAKPSRAKLSQSEVKNYSTTTRVLLRLAKTYNSVCQEPPKRRLLRRRRRHLSESFPLPFSLSIARSLAWIAQSLCPLPAPALSNITIVVAAAAAVAAVGSMSWSNTLRLCRLRLSVC